MLFLLLFTINIDDFENRLTNSIYQFQRHYKESVNRIGMTNQVLKPIQLISFTQEKKLQVNTDAIKWLNESNQDKHIGVITVVGKYRTGKSYILNRVLLGQNSGFQVGPTINACTKGLWVWPKLIESPDDPSLQFLVMDTEGLGSLEEGQQTDTKIFLMAMLLSSFFIYNSQGSIDQKAVQSLSLIINLSKILQKGGENQMQDILNCFPSFLWLVRDFALKLVDQQGIQLSPKQYLENALRLQQGNSEMIVRKNSVRKEMLNFFRQRDCFMLIRPVDDQKKLQNMAKVKDHQLRPQFLDLVKQLQSKIFKTAKKKTFKSKPCSPSMFIELCQYFCDSINKGGLPQIESNWDLVCKAQAARVQKKCTQQFQFIMRKYQNFDLKTVNLNRLQSEISQKMTDLLKYFEKNALGAKQQKKRQLQQKLQTEFQQLRKRISEQKNQEIQQNFTVIGSKLEDLINQNQIQDIFQIAGEYDSMIEKEKQNANIQTLSYLYKKAYENLKSSSFTFFGATYQAHKHESSVLSEKLDIYQNSLNRIQGEQAKRSQQSEKRERQLRQTVYHLEAKAHQTLRDLQNARKELQNLNRSCKVVQQDKENIGCLKL